MFSGAYADNLFMTKTILIIDDNADFRETVIDILVDNDFDIYEASCPKDGFDILFREPVDVILCDLNMPFTEGKAQSEYLKGNKVGINTIKELGYAFPNLPIICVTAEDSIELAKASRELGDVPLIRKPIGHKLLLEEIDKACRFQPDIFDSDFIITH